MTVPAKTKTMLTKKLNANLAVRISASLKRASTCFKAKGGVVTEANLEEWAGGPVQFLRVPAMPGTLLVSNEAGASAGGEVNPVATMLAPVPVFGDAILIKEEWLT
jgi:hypothetical protein